MQDTQPRAFGADAEAMPEEDLANATEEPATEEEQALYNLVVARAYKFIYGDGKDQTLKLLSSGENPADGIGRATSMIISTIEKSALESGKEIPDYVLFHAGNEIVQDLAELGTAANVFQFRDEAEAQEQAEQGLFYALKYYGEESLADGTADQETAMKIVQEGIQREQQAGSARVGEAVRGAMNPPQGAPAGGEGIARKPGVINAAMGV